MSFQHYRRTFPVVFDQRIYGANRTAGFPTKSEGIIFWRTSASAVDAKDSNIATHYERAKLGSASVLTDDQIKRIVDIINEGRDKDNLFEPRLPENLPPRETPETNNNDEQTNEDNQQSEPTSNNQQRRYRTQKPYPRSYRPRKQRVMNAE